MVALMLLTRHPHKQGIHPEALRSYPDLDLSWCFDFLHAHCRSAGPDYTDFSGLIDSPSWSLESYGDAHMCMHFTVHGFAHLREQTPETTLPSEAGMLCSRREIHTHFVGTFQEWRTTIVVQFATAEDRHGKVSDLAPDLDRPEILGFTLKNDGPERLGWKDGDWDDDTLVCPAEARGVAVFQRLLGYYAALCAKHDGYRRKLRSRELNF